MSTEKSCLTWEQVLPSIDEVITSNEYGEVTLPIGYNSELERMHYITLTDETKAAHLAVLGLPGSGTTNVLTFLICCLERMYGKHVRISIIDSEGHYSDKWLPKSNRQKVLRAGLCRRLDTGSVDEVLEALSDVAELVKSGDEKDIIVMDEAFVTLREKSAQEKFEQLVDLLPRYDGHLILSAGTSTVHPMSKMIASWDNTLVTRTMIDASFYYLCDTSAGVTDKKYGTVVAKTRDTITRLAAPYVSNDIVTNMKWRKRV